MNSKPENISIIGCGYIGKRLAIQLLSRDVLLTGYVSSKESVAECDRQQIPCETFDLDNPSGNYSFRSHRIIYLAPPPASGRQDKRMQAFLELIKNSPPEKFVYISTTGVYGDCNGEWIYESQPLDPKADRAYRRVDAESRLRQFCEDHKIPLVILRVAGIYGPGKIPVERIKSGQPVVRKEDSPYTNRIHADDLVNICEQSLLQLDITGTFNVTDGHPSTMFDYFNHVAKALNLPAPPAISISEASEKLSAGVMSYMAESRRISNELLLDTFKLKLQYPDLQHGIKSCVEPGTPD